MSQTGPSPTATPGWANGGPLPMSDNQTVRAIPEQSNPVVIQYGDRNEPTAAEIEAERLRRMRPAGTMPADYRRALDAIEAEQAIAVTRLAGSKERVTALMRGDGTAADIQSTRTRAEHAQIEVDRLELRRADVTAGLARAQAAEEDALRRLAAAVPAAKATLAAYLKAITTDFPKHASAVAAILAMEAGAEEAVGILTAAASKLAGHEAPESVPRAPDGKAWRATVNLPGHVSPPAPAFSIASIYAQS